MTLLRLSRSLVLMSLMALASLHVSSCAAWGDGSDSDQNADEATTEEQELTTSCTPERILAGAPAGRRAIIERALRWVRLRIMYSQTSTFEGYRRDCSGFCSMSWGLPQPGPWTGLLAPASTRYSHTIGWNDLEVGDALNDPAHHVMLFGGWMNSAHTSMCIIQENRTGTPANISARTRSTLGGYHPIRFNHNPPGVFDGPPPDPHCPRTGTAQVCLDRDTTATCTNGQITARTNCATGSICSTGGDQPAHCASTECVASATTAPRVHDTCLPDGRIAHCDGHGVLQSPHACASGTRCTESASTATCTTIPVTPTPSGDSGTSTDASSTPAPADDAGSAPPEDAGSSGDDAGTSAPDAAAVTPSPTRDGGTSDAGPRDASSTARCADGHAGADGGCGRDNSIEGGMSCAARPMSRSSRSGVVLALAFVAMAVSRIRRAQGVRRPRT